MHVNHVPWRQIAGVEAAQNNHPHRQLHATRQASSRAVRQTLRLGSTLVLLPASIAFCHVAKAALSPSRWSATCEYSRASRACSNRQQPPSKMRVRPGMMQTELTCWMTPWSDSRVWNGNAKPETSPVPSDSRMTGVWWTIF